MKDGVKRIYQNKNESIQRDREYENRDRKYLESSQEVQYIMSVTKG